jgi:hypothetical protein
MTPHTVDIWGRPWAPCAGCPHPTPGSCCSRRHPAYCDLHASDPATWDPKIARQGPEDRPGQVVVFESEPPPVFAPVQGVAGAEPPLPPLATMAVSYLKSTARHLAAGSPKASPELQAARLAACEACEHLRPSDRRCGLVKGTGCGCGVRAKSVRLLEVCPDNRWPLIDP